MTRRQFFERIKLGALGGLVTPYLGCTAGPEAPLRVGAIPWPGYECLFLARALGLWNNLALKLVDYPTVPESIRAFRNGALEVVAITGDDFLRLAAEEPSVRAILVTDFSNGADALISRPEYDSVRSLAGKRVGVEVNAIGAFMLTRALDAAGLTARSVQVVPLDIDQHRAAFVNRTVEGIVTAEPARTRIVREGGRVLFDSSHIPGEISDLLVTRTDVLARRMNAIRALIGSWFTARQHLLNHLAEAASLIAPHEGLTPEEFLETLKLISIPSLEENRHLFASLDTHLMEGLDKTHRVMHQAGHRRIARPALHLFDGRALS